MSVQSLDETSYGIMYTTPDTQSQKKINGVSLEEKYRESQEVISVKIIITCYLCTSKWL